MAFYTLVRVEGPFVGLVAGRTNFNCTVKDTETGITQTIDTPVIDASRYDYAAILTELADNHGITPNDFDV